MNPFILGLIALCLCGSVAEFKKGNTHMAWYWVFVALLNYSIMIRGSSNGHHGINPVVVIMTAFNVGALLWEAYHRNLPMTTYWVAAAAINTTIILLGTRKA